MTADLNRALEILAAETSMATIHVITSAGLEQRFITKPLAALLSAVAEAETIHNYCKVCTGTVTKHTDGCPLVATLQAICGEGL